MQDSTPRTISSQRRIGTRSWIAVLTATMTLTWITVTRSEVVCGARKRGRYWCLWMAKQSTSPVAANLTWGNRRNLLDRGRLAQETQMTTAISAWQIPITPAHSAIYSQKKRRAVAGRIASGEPGWRRWTQTNLARTWTWRTWSTIRGSPRPSTTR